MARTSLGPNGPLPMMSSRTSIVVGLGETELCIVFLAFLTSKMDEPQLSREYCRRRPWPIIESQRWESNPQPPHYECGALPIEATLAGASGRKRRTAETVKLAQMVTRRQVVRVFKGFCDRTAHKYRQTNTRAQNKKVGSRLGRSVLPKSSGSGARRPLDQKSRRPHFLRCGDGTRKNPAGN